MLRCIQIGRNALGRSAPNPMVGALLTHGETVIGSGYTSAFGGPHAEVNAIRSVADPGKLPESTLYVTLEPCCHHGKTPPCTDRIIASGIRRVVVGLKDPHHRVAGQGIVRLKEAGCQVEVGVAEDACREHHRRFLTLHEKGRPYIVLKWAQSPDGFLAPDPQVRGNTAGPWWITGPESRQLVHKWRTQESAILVGWRTAAADDPQLTSRDWVGKNPLRIVLDPAGRAPEGIRLLDGTVPTLRVLHPGQEPAGNGQVENIIVEPGPRFLQDLCAELRARGVLSLLVEGGAHTLGTFLTEGLWDEARVFTGPIPLNSGLRAPSLSGKLVSKTASGADTLTILRND